jgi:hypothetical protein
LLAVDAPDHVRVSWYAFVDTGFVIAGDMPVGERLWRVPTQHLCQFGRLLFFLAKLRRQRHHPEASVGIAPNAMWNSTHRRSMQGRRNRSVQKPMLKGLLQ